MASSCKHSVTAAFHVQIHVRHHSFMSASMLTIASSCKHTLTATFQHLNPYLPCFCTSWSMLALASSQTHLRSPLPLHVRMQAHHLHYFIVFTSMLKIASSRHKNSRSLLPLHVRTHARRYHVIKPRPSSLLRIRIHACCHFSRLPSCLQERIPALFHILQTKFSITIIMLLF